MMDKNDTKKIIAFAAFYDGLSTEAKNTLNEDPIVFADKINDFISTDRKIGLKRKNEPSGGISVTDTDIIKVYTDGSYMDRYDYCRYGVICLDGNDNILFTENRVVDSPDLLKMRNISREIQRVLSATAKLHDLRLLENNKIEIHHDYTGLAYWVNGDWKPKNSFTQNYASVMKDFCDNFNISFVKEKAHSNVEYNDKADQLAKLAIFEAADRDSGRTENFKEELDDIPFQL